MSRPELEWRNVNSRNCPDVVREAFEMLQTAMQDFEELFQDNAPKGKVVKFSYKKRNGEIEIGVALDDAKYPSSNGRIDWLPGKVPS